LSADEVTRLYSSGVELASTAAITTSPFSASSFGGYWTRSDSDRLTAGDSSSLSITGAMTIEAWANFNSTPSSGSIYSIAAKWNHEGTGNSDRSYQAALRNDSGTLKAILNTSSNGGNSGVTQAQWNWTPTLGQWYHLAWVFDGSGNAIFYVDGTSQGTATGQNTSISNQSQSVYIGAAGNGSGGAEEFFDGQLDEVRVWNAARTGTQLSNNKSVELAGNESGLVAYYPFEDIGDDAGSPFALYDRMSNANDLTNSGATETTDTPITQSARAANLTAASSHYLYAPDSTSLSYTASMSAEAYVKFTSLPSSGNEMTIASKYRSDNNQRSWAFSLHNNAGTYQLKAGTSTNGTNFETASVNWTPSTGTWYHVAMVYDASAPNIKFYVDGTQQGSTQTVTHTSIYDSTTALQIGAINHGGTTSQHFNGKIDEVRIWNVARSSENIANNKNSEIQVDTLTGLVSYYYFENYSYSWLPPYDETVNGNKLTNTIIRSWTTDRPFTASSRAARSMAATGQYLTAADSSSLSITGALTVEGWVKFDTLPSSGNHSTLVSKFLDTGDQRSYTTSLKNNSGTYQLRAAYSTDGTSQAANEAVVSWTPSTGTWYHVAFVFDVSNSQVLFYVDGTQQGSTQTGPTGTSIYNSTADLRIGADNSGDQRLDGKIDDVRIWNTVRTGTEISNNKSVELIGSESGLAAYFPFEVL
jgi:hypothetical protein